MSNEDTITSLFAHKLIFVTGKGGTGKTLITAYLAQKAALLGKRVLICELGASAQISGLFGINEDIDYQPKSLSEHIHTARLSHRDCLKEYIVDRLRYPTIYEKVFTKNVVRSFLEAVPGLGEVMILGKLVYEAKRAYYDLVLFDAPATGHFIQLLATPQNIRESGLIGPLVNEVREIEEYLADQINCAISLVSLPESLVLDETIEFMQYAQSHIKTPISLVILNQMLPELAKNLQILNSPKLAQTTLCSYLHKKLELMQQGYALLTSELAKYSHQTDLVLTKEMGILKTPLLENNFMTGFLLGKEHA